MTVRCFRRFYSQAPKMSDQIRKCSDGAVWGMLIADALSMPVHWYYNPQDIYTGYGSWLTGYVAPNKRHPSSILSLSSVDGSGRTGWHSKSKQIIGSVILHDKLKYWQGDRSTHYHQGMRAGDNTLNSLTALNILNTLQQVDPNLTKSSRNVRGLVLEEYVKFMTTPGTHNDTYAESFHRSFFKDWASEEKKLVTAEELLEFTDKRYQQKSKGPGDSQLVVIGAMSPALPWIIRNAHRSEDECARETIDFVKCTHPVPAIIPFVDLYARLLHGVINGKDLKQEVLRVLSHSELGGPRKREMVVSLIERAERHPKGSEERLRAYQTATQTLGSACYVEGAMSSMLFLAYEFAEDFRGGVLSNANCGGENCHRGAALGALLGANAINKGKDIPQNLKEGLQAKETVKILLEQMKESNNKQSVS
ncbi:uncharacterized protein LOC132719151 isoform X2 [Ruditapes philippinarum]|uniref:uncharacterized protein LOC132719151 isoform X2 n=1 Tax=Ruditapes philippinarum TaxID=129788 RepID=UPI00295AA798|nr:uncharacterized protein LOC132719151 isoform X2 [Ruditapes philippinarum]